MSAEIHPTAVVDQGVQIGDNVVIGPHAIVEDNVIVGCGTVINAGAHIAWGTRLGKDVRIFSYAVVGTVPQDLKFGGEETTLNIGDRTVIREFVTINRGTHQRGCTTIGADCLLMSYSHVAHDCLVGDHVIMANSATLAGHVTVEDWVIIGGLVPVHQFVKIGCHAIIGGGWRVPKDVPPYMMVAGEPLRPLSLNIIGLKRRGFSETAVHNLKKAYKTLFRSKYDMTRSLEQLDDMGDLGEEVEHLKSFIRSSERGVSM